MWNLVDMSPGVFLSPARVRRGILLGYSGVAIYPGDHGHHYWSHLGWKDITKNSPD